MGIYAEEEGILSELKALSVFLAGLSEADPQVVNACLDKREPLLARIAELSAQGAKALGARPLTAGEKEKADRLEALSSELLLAEKEAGENLSKLLGDLKVEARGLDRGREGLKNYYGSLRQTHGGTDRRG